MQKIIHKYKIFGRRKGRKSSNIIDNKILEEYQLNIPNDLNKQKIILDIGSGSGESTLFLSKKNPNKLIIASDVYMDGNFQLSQHLKEKKIKNVKLYRKNILFLFDEFNFKNLIDQIWILFPDPWPKKKHFKRRLINYDFLHEAHFLLKKNGKIFLATDSRSYFLAILKTIYNLKFYKWINYQPFEWDYLSNDLPKTKYFKKAYRSGKKSFFLILKKI